MLDFVLQGLRAAAEPTRLRLLALCADSELTVTELTEILGQSQPRVSHHLKQLCDTGLLERRQEGTWAFYRVISDGAGKELAQKLLALLPKEDEALILDQVRLSKVKQARAVGLFGCVDIQKNSAGDFIAEVHDPLPPAMAALR